MIPTKKLRSGFELPVLGFGTWRMGGRMQYDPSNDDEADVAAIRAALDAGVTHIDTAEVYAEGHAEKLVGRAIQGRDRASLQIVSKAFKNSLKPDDLRRACEATLTRLGTDYLDAYLIHRFVPSVPLKDTMGAMDQLVEEGLIKHIGVSNFNAEHLKEAQVYASHPIVCNQVHYNLMFRQPERSGLLEYCQQNNVILVAWRPVQNGTIATNPPVILQELSTKYQKTPAQISMNWLISQPNVVTIFKTLKTDHLNENLGAAGWELSAEDIERLRRDYPDQKEVSDSVPLE